LFESSSWMNRWTNYDCYVSTLAKKL
jgi:hypothetical protein